MTKKIVASLFIICLSVILVQSLPVVATNPFYVSTEGEAELIDGEQIKGKFYYHEPPIGDDDSFYFYPSDIKSLRIIPIAKVKKAAFPDNKKGSAEFTLVGSKLQRTLPDGKIQLLTTRVLRHL